MQSKFRYYQTEADDAIYNELITHNKCIVKMFCGTGKSLLMRYCKSTKKQKLITDLTDGPEVKKEPDIIEALNEVVDSISIRYENNYNDESSLFNDLESDVAWTDIKNYKLPTIPSIVSYTTPPTQDLETKNKKIKDLYASSNLNEDESFNGKVTFN